MMIKTYLTFFFKSLKNYIVFRLDKVTIVELVLFVGVVMFFMLQAVFQNLAQAANTSQLLLWLKFFYLQNLGVVALLSPAVFFVRLGLLSDKKQILLTLPIPVSKTVQAEFSKLALAWLIFSPLWLGLLVAFFHYADIGILDMLAVTVYHLVLFLVPLVVVLLFYIARYSKYLKKSLPKWTNAALFIGLFTALCALSGNSQALNRLPLHTLFALIALVLALVLVMADVKSLFARIPERLTTSSTRLARSNRLLGFYLLLTPPAIKPLVNKDAIYFSKKYTSYGVLVWVFIIVMGIGIWRAANGSEGLQWFLFLCITAGYVFANMAFKFSDTQCEQLAQIRMLPITAKTYWFAKFWNGFLPVIWVVLAGSVILWVRHTPPVGSYVLGLIIVLYISATLVFVQNNFALYSYPFPRYASLWYNLYIIIAVLFFTIWLFPPLAVGFLLFGYLAIFRVLKRIKLVDILND